MMDLKQRARHFGASEFGKSYVKGKRFYVKYQGKIIHFEEGIDYKEFNDEKNVAKFGNIRSNAKYYMVTGDCFKMIAMTRNKEIRR